MVRKFTDGFLDHAEKLITDGSNLKETAAFLGCGPDALSKAIRTRNPFFQVDIPGRRVPFNRRDDLPESEIIARYQSGESELSIARRFGIARNAINRILTKNLVRRRDRSSANFVRMSRMSAAERSNLAAAAHEAVRKIGTKNTPRRLLRRAASIASGRCSGQIGPGEIELAAALSRRGHDVKRQMAIEAYNIDIVFGTVAVEVKFGSGARMRQFRISGRLEKILESGLKPALVHIGDGMAIDRAMDEIVALLELIDCKPSTGREYWMIRSGLQSSPITRYNGYKRTAVEASPELVTSIRKVDYC